jgi:hypothetical protein
VRKPQNAERQNAIDHRAGFSLAHTDDGLGRCASEQAPSDVCRSEAVFQVHCGAQPVHFGPDECATENALEDALIVSPSGIARSGGAAIAGRNQFERLGLGCSHATSHEPQELRALLCLDNGANQVALLTPQLKQASAMRFAYGIARDAHVEKDAPVFKHSGRRVIGKVGFDELNELPGIGSGVGRRHPPCLPVLPQAQLGDVRRVMARVPLIDSQDGRQVLASRLGMERVDQRKGDANRQQEAVGQLCPCGLIVRLDRRPILSEGKFAANVGIGVAIGDVMDELTHRPPAFAIGCVELHVVKAVDGNAQTLG